MVNVISVIRFQVISSNTASPIEKIVRSEVAFFVMSGLQGKSRQEQQGCLLWKLQTMKNDEL